MTNRHLISDGKRAGLLNVFEELLCHIKVDGLDSIFIFELKYPVIEY